MNIDELMSMAPSLPSASVSRSANVVAIRRGDGVEATIRFAEGSAIVRWSQPELRTASDIGALNEAGALAVATSRRYDNLYGASAHTYFRARMSLEGLEAALFAKALARDFAIDDTIAPSPVVSLEAIETKLSARPVRTPEQRLLDAIMRTPQALGPSPFVRREGVLVGPSSLGLSPSPRRAPITIEIAPTDLGLIRVRHSASAPPGAEPHAVADAISAECSSEEESVPYARAFARDGVVTVEAITGLHELGSEVHVAKVYKIQRAVAAYLARK